MRLATILLAGAFALSLALPAFAADDSKVKAATRQVETGTKKIGEGVEETAKGIGHTIVEGAKFSGEKIKEGGQAAEPKAKSAWEQVRDGSVDLGRSVKTFFSRLFGS